LALYYKKLDNSIVGVLIRLQQDMIGDFVNTGNFFIKMFAFGPFQ